ncbi:hypothetical protein BaRGS_00000494 [Batillaria attramentaria]|uniref:RRM domain-containing protein n=1 Tax=Batillaria attramentaria TaxID=370345 RepID=A0ABD0M9D6_9CAEN
MSSKLDTRVVQITNVAPATSKDQLKTLFGFLGRIRECKIFPPDGSDQQVAAKVCYVEYEDSTSAGVALHLTNTVFIDRALIVVPVMDGKIPDERVAMQLTPQTVARMTPGQPAWPANVVSQLSGTGPSQMITTYDPRLNALGLPQYPPLPASLDAARVEEIRRTVYIGNLDHKTTADSLITFFSQVGEVKYVRMAGDETSPVRSAYMEFTDQRSVATCLTYNGVMFNGKSITVSHAKTNISKPLTKSQEASRREIEEAMKKVKEAQSLISAAAGEGGQDQGPEVAVAGLVLGAEGQGHPVAHGGHVHAPRVDAVRDPGWLMSSIEVPKVKIAVAKAAFSHSFSKASVPHPTKGILVSTFPLSEQGAEVTIAKPPPIPLSREGSAAPQSGDEGSPAKLDSRDRSKSPVRSSRRSGSRSPVRVSRRRSGSRSPVRHGRRRSVSPIKKRRSKSRSPRRSRSPKRKKARSRSRSGSRHKSKKDKKKERSRSRDRKDKEKKKKSSKDRKEDREKPSRVTRDYDEEEKGFNSGSDHEVRSQPDADDDIDDRRSSVDRQQDDMDTSD